MVRDDWFGDNFGQHAINNCDCCGIENLMVNNQGYNEHDDGWDDEDYLCRLRNI